MLWAGHQENVVGKQGLNSMIGLSQTSRCLEKQLSDMASPHTRERGSGCSGQLLTRKVSNYAGILTWWCLWQIDSFKIRFAIKKIWHWELCEIFCKTSVSQSWLIKSWWCENMCDNRTPEGFLLLGVSEKGTNGNGHTCVFKNFILTVRGSLSGPWCSCL